MSCYHGDCCPACGQWYAGGKPSCGCLDLGDIQKEGKVNVSVRAKFTLAKVERTQQSSWSKDEKGNYVATGTKEMQTLTFSAVSGGSEENKKFWEASPSGQITLGVINPDAWQHFELGKEYYVDFNPAE